MEPHESDAFVDELDTLADVYNCVVDSRKKAAYWRALQDLPLEAVQHACLVVLREESFLPAPSIFRDAARQYLRDQRSRTRPLEDLDSGREDGLAQREIRALMASVWPENAPDASEETAPDATP